VLCMLQLFWMLVSTNESEGFRISWKYKNISPHVKMHRRFLLFQKSHLK
jgi:hypothetical protein